jgi:hypothetical protein
MDLEITKNCGFSKSIISVRAKAVRNMVSFKCPSSVTLENEIKLICHSYLRKS